MSTQKDRFHEQVEQFADIFGVRHGCMHNGQSHLPVNDFEADFSVIDFSQGAVVNPANTVGLYWDYDKFAQNEGLPDQLSETPVRHRIHNHCGAPAVSFVASQATGETTTVTKEYVDQSAELFERAVLGAGDIRIHPTDNYPIKVNDRLSDRFLLIAPRRRDD